MRHPPRAWGALLLLLLGMPAAAALARRSRAPAAAGPVRRDTALFAGGCFWSMELPFAHVPGVVETTVGEIDAQVADERYARAAERTSGHAETVQVVYDRTRVSYEQLLTVFWHNVDPLTRDRQFCDGGPRYRTIVLYANDAQRDAALSSRAALDASRRFPTPVVTEIVPATGFWPAGREHQRFAERFAARYTAYRRGCGRDARLRALWGDSAEPWVRPLR